MDQITNLIESQTIEFEKLMENVINNLNLEINKILDSFNIINGTFEISEDNIDKVLVIKAKLERALRNSGYSELAGKILGENEEILKDQYKRLPAILKKKLGGVDITTLKALQATSFEGMMDIAESRLLAIKESLFNAVTLGLDRVALQENLSMKLGQLNNYASTYIRTAKRQYAQSYENIVAEDVGFGSSKDDIWEYLGAPLQDNSHKECIWALKKKAGAPYFTNKEKEAFGVYEPRYNCQHRFVMSNVTYKEAFGDA